MKQFIILYCIFFSCGNFCYGQELKKYEDIFFNLNIDNGLPSNHIYGITVDRYGYMWMGTDKGVVKYNGYECKVFNLSDGLPIETTWQIMEDKRGRIWLGNLSNEMGYIYKDVYHKAGFNNANRIIYPKDFSIRNDGIVFFSANVGLNTMVSIEENNVFHKYALPENISTPEKNIIKQDGKHAAILFIDHNGGIFEIYNETVFLLSPDATGNKLSAKKLSTLSSQFPWKKWEFSPTRGGFIVDSFLIINSLDKANEIYAANLHTGDVQKISISNWVTDTAITFIYVNKSIAPRNNFYVIADQNILEFRKEKKIEFVKSYSINDFLPEYVENYNINTFYDHPFWGKWLCTNTNGAYIKNDSANYFNKTSAAFLQNYLFIGGEDDKAMFWWNNSTHSLAVISDKNKIKYFKLPGTEPLRNIIYYRDDSIFIKSSHNANCYLYNSKTGKLNPLPDCSTDLNETFFEDNNNLISVNIANFFTGKKSGADMLLTEIIDTDRYIGLQYDATRKNYWAYNHFKITQYKWDKGKVVFNNSNLPRFGVNIVDKILIDNTYGNVFVQGNDRISLYNPAKNTYTLLFRNVYLKDSKILLYHNTLIVIGRFGILFSKISSADKIADPIIYYNRKNIKYKRFYSAQASWNKVYLTTDKGTYAIDVPADSLYAINSAGNTNAGYRLLVSYRDSITVVGKRDTIKISQKYPVLRFDVINPFGNGTLKYACKTNKNDSVWHELNSNELAVPQSLEPGAYHQLSIKVHDDVWESDQMVICLYIEPYWWQVLIYSRFFWPGMGLIVLALITLIVFITRRVVMRNNIKRNLQRELELKSVYSQINPHFIFNTLGTILFFIKKRQLDEAYDHVSKFSRLLRAFIKSSRNKFITIAADVENLNNYIQLQQTRFENKFDYQIIIDPDIEISTVSIPSLLLQPIVENAIDHGLFHKEGKGHLKIEFKRASQANELLCIIDDDGIGRKKSKLILRNSLIKTESYGESLVTDLVSIFNKYEKMNIAINYKDKTEPETGTTVTISIKYL